MQVWPLNQFFSTLKSIMASASFTDKILQRAFKIPCPFISISSSLWNPLWMLSSIWWNLSPSFPLYLPPSFLPLFLQNAGVLCLKEVEDPCHQFLMQVKKDMIYAFKFLEIWEEEYIYLLSLKQMMNYKKYLCTYFSLWHDSPGV